MIVLLYNNEEMRMTGRFVHHNIVEDITTNLFQTFLIIYEELIYHLDTLAFHIIKYVQSPSKAIDVNQKMLLRYKYMLWSLYVIYKDLHLYLVIC